MDKKYSNFDTRPKSGQRVQVELFEKTVEERVYWNDGISGIIVWNDGGGMEIKEYFEELRWADLE